MQVFNEKGMGAWKRQREGEKSPFPDEANNDPGGTGSVAQEPHPPTSVVEDEMGFDEPQAEFCLDFLLHVMDDALLGEDGRCPAAAALAVSALPLTHGLALTALCEDGMLPW